MSSRVSRGKGSIVTINRSIVGAFRGDDMLLHYGSGCVAERPRHGLDGQAIGTEFCHRRRFRLRSLAVRPHRVAMVEQAQRARLMPRLRLTPALELTARAAVDLPSVVELTEAAEEPATGAPNLDQNLDTIHARTATRAQRTCLARTHSGTVARSASTARPKAQGVNPWAFTLVRPTPSEVRDPVTRRHFSTGPSLPRFLRI